LEVEQELYKNEGKKLKIYSIQMSSHVIMQEVYGYVIMVDYEKVL